jgi:IS1 family transposase
MGETTVQGPATAGEWTVKAVTRIAKTVICCAFGNNGSETLVEVVEEEERHNTCDRAWQNKHWTNELA